MVEFKVGEAFPLPPVQSEGAIFSIEPYTMILTYRYNKPTEQEIEEFKNGDYELAVAELRDVIFVLSKFGRLGWADAAYNPNLSDTEKNLPDLVEGNRGYSVDAFLVDLSTNTLVAKRLIRMDPNFSKKFKKLIEQSIGRKDRFQKDQFETTVQTLYKSYSTKDLYRYSLMKMKMEKEQ